MNLSLLPLRSSHLLLGAIALLHLLGGCASPDDAGQADDLLPPEDALRVVVSIDRPVYPQGDSLVVSVRLSNAATEPARLAFSTSQRFDFVILDMAREEVLRWSEDQVFLQVTGEELLMPDEPPLSWSERIPAPLEPGRYLLRGEVPAAGATLSAELPFEVVSGA